MCRALRRNPAAIALTGIACQTGAQSVRIPGIAYLAESQWAHVNGNRTPIPFAPDLAVEVLSPSHEAIALNRKIAEYLAGGTSEVWILDSENVQIQIYSRGGVKRLLAGDRLETPLLPGFSADVAEILRSPFAAEAA